MNDTNLKTQICDALATWIRQRPRLDYGNYVSPGTISREQIEGGRRAYRKECRDIARDKRDAETLLAAVRWRDSITAEDLLKASKHAFSGRLSIQSRDVGPPSDKRTQIVIDYCTGQYWPTEYRKAAAAVLASALWDYQRDTVSDFAEVGAGTHSPGDLLRRHFRKEFGSALQRRWFN